MLAAVHVADLPLRSIPSILRATRMLPVPGLRRFDGGVCAPFTDGPPRPQLRRWAVFSFWDEERHLDEFESTHTVGRQVASGWSARLEPVRAHGFWPGLDPSVPSERGTDHGGRSVVFTLGWLRLTQAPRFLRYSDRASKAVVGRPGLVWATAAVRPPHFVATCSVWESTEALSRYAYGRSQPAHPDAIAAGQSEPFHHAEAFIRFRPVGETGRLGGRNPFPSGDGQG